MVPALHRRPLHRPPLLEPGAPGQKKTPAVIKFFSAAKIMKNQKLKEKEE
jgi:hypothetical protein